MLKKIQFLSLFSFWYQFDICVDTLILWFGCISAHLHPWVRRGGGGREERWIDGWIEGEEGWRDTIILLCHDLGGCLSFCGNKMETITAEDCVGICVWAWEARTGPGRKLQTVWNNHAIKNILKRHKRGSGFSVQVFRRVHQQPYAFQRYIPVGDGDRVCALSIIISSINMNPVSSSFGRQAPCIMRSTLNWILTLLWY